MGKQSSSKHANYLLVHLLVIGNRLGKAVASSGNALNQRGTGACSDTKGKDSRSTPTISHFLVDKLEKTILVPDLTICEQEDFEVHVLVALLESSLERLVHLSAAIVAVK